MTIADAAYRALAARLDELPHGFPPGRDEVELRILAKIFAPGEAAFALHLLPVPEGADAIAARARRPAGEVAALLETMAAKGQIAGFRHRGRRLFALVPFVPGIYEFQLARLDAELAALFEAYVPDLLRTVGGVAPAVARVLPVNAAVGGEAQVLAHEDVRAMIEGAARIRLMDCICRLERELEGHGCGHLREACLTFTSRPDGIESHPMHGRFVTREEALAVLDRAEAEGLVHCTYNVRGDSIFVCNCCRCCCGFLRGVADFGAPHLLVRSNYVAAIEAELCCACAGCVERCPMEAISAPASAPADTGAVPAPFEVAGARCIGCGLCAVACATGALVLHPRPPAERTEPPRDIAAWAFVRARNRSGFLRAATQFAGIGVAAARAAAAARLFRAG